MFKSIARTGASGRIAKRLLPVPLLLVMLITMLAWPGASMAQEENVPPTFPPPQSRYFPETGHSAVNYFLEKWKNTPNALFTLGMPISQPFIEESFTNPGEYYRVQYFERGVLEELPQFYGQDDNQFYVQGRLLGRQLAQGRETEEPFQAIADPGDGTWIESTGHTLRDEPAPFRTFWENNGALAVFGYPISEQFQEVNEADGQTYWVQYFERQRMEWHPDEPNPQYQVLLGLLGNEARDANHGGRDEFDARGPDGALPKPFIYGWNAHLYLDGLAWQDRGRVLEISKNAEIYWIRQQVAWGDIEHEPGVYYWDELDHIVDDAHNAGVNLLLSVVRAPTWATPDGSNGMPSAEHFGTFANFMGSMANRYRGKVQAYEIWNEQNLAHENGGTVASADHYVGMLAASYDAIKGQDAQAIVVSGGPSSTETNEPSIAVSDVDFMRQMLNNPEFRADVIGLHPGGQLNPPDAMWPDNPGPGPSWQDSREFYFRRIEDIRQVMVESGWGDRQVWLTEFGWATANNTPGYEYGNQISFEQQAEWIVRAFEKGRYEYAPWVGAMFLWNLNFAIPWGAEGNPLHEQASFGVLNPDWSPRPAWHAIQSMPKD
jgi:hypothetical protein